MRKVESQEWYAKFAYRLGSNFVLEPWKPEKAKNRSGGGRWVCDNCCQYQRGSKLDHKRLCLGFKKRIT
jgi:hypothetical protein